jgi:iron complex outermembrane receptor protein
MRVKSLVRLLVLPLILVSLQAWSQNKKITGKVADAKDGKPLAGATIKPKGSGGGTSSGADGSFTLNVPENTTELEVSMINYASVTIAISGDNMLVALEPSAGSLTDVVVIGYGSQRKKDLTGSITTVTTKDFVKAPFATPEQLISGKVAGVQVTGNSGEPGTGSSIRVRGQASLSASSAPLIVIDGVPVDNGGIAGSPNPLSLINPNDIESFVVLKDASSAAIYGSRATNGVILITTKKGSKSGKLKVNFNTTASEYVANNLAPVLTADQFRTVVNEKGSEAQKALLGNSNTDWQNEIIRRGFATDNNLSLSGGIKGLPYRISLGYYGQGGILKTNSLKRPSAGLNLNPKFFNNHLSVDISLKGSISESRFADVGGSLGGAAAFDPTQSVFGGPQKFGGYFQWLDAAGNPLNLAPRNPLATLEQVNNTSEVYRSVGNIQIDYKFHFLPELRANINLGYDASTSRGTVISDPQSIGLIQSNLLNGSRFAYSENIKNQLLETYLNYTKELSSLKSKIEVTAGYGYYDFLRVIPDNNPATDLKGDTLPNAQPGVPDKPQYTMLSAYGRLIYTFDNRFILTATYRTDASSKFPSAGGNRWGQFPSAALAWRISNEKFLKGSDVVSDLKLRVGYGETGQQDFGNYYQYIAFFTPSTPTATYQLGNEFYQTYRPTGYNSEIKWEQTAMRNIGLDFGLFKNRISGTVDVYSKKTTDLLLFTNVPAGSNLTNRLFANIGSMKSEGVEATLNAGIIQGKNFSWDMSINATVQRIELTDLTLNPDPTFQGFEVGGIAGGVGNNIQIHSVGYAPNAFFVFKQVYDQNGNPLEGVYEDLNGDGIISADDKYRYKSPNPDAFFGTTHTFSYKNLTLTAVLRANVGNYMYNNLSSNNGAYAVFGRNNGFLSNMHPSVLQTNFQNNQLFSDYYVENASFLRMDNINLTYNVGRIGNGVNLRLSGIVQNVFTVTKYSGIDPEINGGIDNNFYPRPTIYSISANIDF